MNEKLKGTKTEANLHEAFAGQSQATRKYEIFAQVAAKEGHHGIAKVFMETGGNEKAHAKMWLRQLGKIGDTVANLKTAAEGEHYEWTDMYKRMEADARAEGFVDIADSFKMVGDIERTHENRYNQLREWLVAGELYKSDEPVWWECLNCHHHHKGTEAPAMCPTCVHPQGWFWCSTNWTIK